MYVAALACTPIAPGDQYAVCAVGHGVSIGALAAEGTMTNSDRRFVLMALVRLRLLLAHHEIQVPRPTVQVYAHAMRILSKERKLEAAAYRHTDTVVGGEG